jgi:hypothetical protein
MISQQLISSKVPLTDYDDLEVIREWLLHPILDMGAIEEYPGRYLEVGCNDSLITEFFSFIGWEGVRVKDSLIPVKSLLNSTLVTCSPGFRLLLVLAEYPPPYDLVLFDLNRRTLHYLAELICFYEQQLPKVLCIRYQNENQVEEINKRVERFYSTIIRTKKNIICRK